ncbi:lysophospholipid acyltransferase family protein [Paenibacillus chungangensis]|uniref:Lysophospholipid acyltransferase family protein n=1 Tax=Paenibacillus chungangensis TaxID=696535 RepID=A0ABW3HLP7_9BACL
MMTANRSERFSRLFAIYNERILLPRYINSVSVMGTPDCEEEGRPLLYVMNHSSWWDGIIAYHVFTRLSRNRKHYIMMDEKQLAKFTFFRRLGAFSIDKSTLRGVAESLRYAQSLLMQGHGVWLFPQGEIRHLEARPLSFQSGVGFLLERCPSAAVKPVTAYYAMSKEQKPVVTLRFGDELLLDWQGLGRKAIVSRLQVAIESQLDEQRQNSITADGGVMEGYRTILQASSSTSGRYESMRRRLASWNPFSG